MNAYKVRLKYYVYGILFGFIIAFAVHMIYLGIALTDIREVLSCVIIDLAFFFVWFLLYLFLFFVWSAGNTGVGIFSKAAIA